MIVYLDTSAFVKLIVHEAGSAEVHGWFSEARRATSSAITYAEASAALFRRNRDAGPVPTRLAAWVLELDSRWERTLTIPVAERSAGQLAMKHGLRGMDAVHLAAAMTLRDDVRSTSPESRIAFAAFDRRLLEAAEREGFATLGRPLA